MQGIGASQQSVRTASAYHRLSHVCVVWDYVLQFGAALAVTTDLQHNCYQPTAGMEGHILPDRRRTLSLQLQDDMRHSNLKRCQNKIAGRKPGRLSARNRLLILLLIFVVVVSCA